jgi:hypothetical protein
MPQMSSRPDALRTAGWTWSHQKLLGNVVEREARALHQTLPDVDVVADLAHRQAVQGLLPGPCVEQHGPVELLWIEQVRKLADGVSEIYQPILEGPPRNIAPKPEAEGEVGRAAGLKRRLDMGRLLRQG